MATNEMHRRVDPSRGLEHVPQLVVLGRGVVAEPLVELEVGHVDLQVQRRRRRVAQTDRSRRRARIVSPLDPWARLIERIPSSTAMSAESSLTGNGRLGHSHTPSRSRASAW